MRSVWLDIETTGLDPLKHSIIEVGMVVDRGSPTLPESVEVHFSLPFSRSSANARALEINRYDERREELNEIEIPKLDAVELLQDHLTDALVIGNNVQFDLRFIEQFIEDAPWYYVPLDLKVLVAGRCGMDHPASTQTIADVSGVPLTKDAHTALADARWNREVYRALLGR